MSIIISSSSIIVIIFRRFRLVSPRSYIVTLIPTLTKFHKRVNKQINRLLGILTLTSCTIIFVSGKYFWIVPCISIMYILGDFMMLHRRFFHRQQLYMLTPRPYGFSKKKIFRNKRKPCFSTFYIIISYIFPFSRFHWNSSDCSEYIKSFS